jgi:hypothetical protein
MECNGNGLCFNFDEKPDVSVDESQQPPYSTRRKGGRRWCANGCACWRIAASIPQLEQELPEKRASLRSLMDAPAGSWHMNKR